MGLRFPGNLMGYQFADGFDNYGNNFDLASGYPWDNVTSSLARVITSDFRFAPPFGIPGGCLKFQSNSTGTWVRKNLGTYPGSASNPQTLFVVLGVKFPTLPASNGTFLILFDTNSFQLMLTLNATGQLQFFRGNFAAGVGTQTAVGTITANTWYGMMIAVTIDPAVGSVQLFLNGSTTPIINSTGLNTRATANSSVNQVALGDSSNNIGQFTILYDDFVCFDNIGAAPNALPNYDPRLFSKLATSPGNYSNWSPTGLTPNWRNAGQAPPNVSNYNANNVGGTKDSYGVPAIGLTQNPFFVLTRASLTRDDAGPHTPSLMVRSGPTDGVSAALPAIPSSYVFEDYLTTIDPNTGLVWTGPNADAAQPGIVEG